MIFQIATNKTTAMTMAAIGRGVQCTPTTPARLEVSNSENEWGQLGQTAASSGSLVRHDGQSLDMSGLWYQIKSLSQNQLSRRNLGILAEPGREERACR